MGDEPFIQDWDLLVGADLTPHLIPRSRLRHMQRPRDAGAVPDGARQALTDRVGRHGLEDMLLVPATARPAGPRWRPRCRYAPPSVLAIGERALGLWVQAVPSPDVRVALPLGAIAAVEQRADGPWRQLIVTGPDGTLAVQYDAGGDAAAGTWVRRL
jgi:hypothetical protein